MVKSLRQSSQPLFPWFLQYASLLIPFGLSNEEKGSTEEGALKMFYDVLSNHRKGKIVLVVSQKINKLQKPHIVNSLSSTV